MPNSIQSVVVDTTKSPFVRLRPVSISAVRLNDTFWEPRRRFNREVTIPTQHKHIVDTNRLRNFERVAGDSDAPFDGLFFNDSDVYKWLEAASSSLAGDPNPELDAIIDRVIEIIGKAQRADGYLYTFLDDQRAAERWSNLRDMHELYCAGHFIQAAVAHHRATGKDSALAIARRLGDCICRTFGDGEGQLRTTDGHEEIEMAMVELARETGDDLYRKQAEFFLDVRGQKTIGGDAYRQDHEPLRAMNRMTGHAVRAVYYMCGAADVLAETGEPELQSALERLWSNMVDRQMYVSGGIGSRWEGEAFGDDYELPNARAYTETCAAIGSVMWNWRMLQITGEARFADVLERALYNGVLPGLSLDGQQYFYQNPLADNGEHRREAWFGCACCPPNVARLLAQLPGYFYSTSDEGIWVHLYAKSDVTLAVGETQVRLRQETDYPWDGTVTITVDAVSPARFAIRLRIPDWCSDCEVTMPGDDVAHGKAGSYLTIERVWRQGDRITVVFPMPIRRVQSNPKVLENTNRIALMRGPLLYCVESIDNPGLDLRDLMLPLRDDLEPRRNPELLGGVVTLHGSAFRQILDDEHDALYRTSGAPPEFTAWTRDLTAVPYYAWANRQAGQMQVWLKA